MNNKVLKFAFNQTEVGVPPKKGGAIKKKGEMVNV